ncbi:cell division protein FtsQ/DivIB [Luteipulveratus mongoliensis]|uniref:cell division protein FtsQ/DivIB n=1 Tax=Luteipulveratus mongoliensis TaxID=571913 RepID=UPI000698F65B|nr:FtsQ-type POTRA domain-containing protein [Luteipulveratus mongoliensis]
MSAPHTRFAERAASVRVTARRRHLIAAGVVALVVGLIWLVAFSPAIAVRQVKVEGASAALEQQVRQATRSAMGRPLLRTDPAGVRRSVASLGPVRDVQVTRSFPSTLVVRVTPRTPVLVVTGPDRIGHLVDENGLSYARTDPTSAAGLPVVPLSQPVSAANQPGLRALAAVMGALSAQERGTVTQVQLDRDGAVSFHLGRLKVQWGDATQSDRKAAALRVMAPQVAAMKATSLDLSAPDRPVLS